MLREVGIDANPALISTRANGKVLQIYPMWGQFNYVLVQVNMEGKSFFIDATDPMAPMDLGLLKSNLKSPTKS